MDFPLRLKLGMRSLILHLMEDLLRLVANSLDKKMPEKEKDC